MTPAPASPIRLRVSFKTPTAVLNEFTRSVGKGVVALETVKRVPVGTRFIFELVTKGVNRSVEVMGEVVSVNPAARGRHLLTIRYDPGADRSGLDAVLREIFAAHTYDKVRAHPRVPLNLRATADIAYSPSFLVRDISRGGVGVEIEASSPPSEVRNGELFLLEVWLTLGPLALHGEIVWSTLPAREQTPTLHPAFGVRFGKLRPETLERLDKIITLRGLPPPPWKARVSFGKLAMSRMP